MMINTKLNLKELKEKCENNKKIQINRLRKPIKLSIKEHTEKIQTKNNVLLNNILKNINQILNKKEKKKKIKKKVILKRKLSKKLSNKTLVFNYITDKEFKKIRLTNYIKKNYTENNILNNRPKKLNVDFRFKNKNKLFFQKIKIKKNP